MVYTPFIWPLIIACLIDAGLAIYAYRYRSSPINLPFQVLMASGALTALLYLGEIAYSDLSTKIFFSQLRFIPAVVLAPTALALVLIYLGEREWLSRPRLLLLFSVPLITAMLSLTGAYHQLFRYDFQIHADSPVAGLVFERGPWWLIYYCYTLSVTAVAVFLLVGSMRKPSSRLRQRNLLIFLLAILSGIVVDLLYVLELTPVHGYYWTPAGFALTGCLFSWAVFTGRIFDFTPVARDRVLENMAGLVIVLDNERRIVDFNRAAQAACGISKEASGRLPEQALRPDWAAALAETQPESGSGEQTELVQAVRLRAGQADSLSDLELRDYELARTAIQDGRGLRLGYLFMFYDITERKAMEEVLHQAHDQLERRVAERTSELSETNSLLQQEINERKHAEAALRESEERFRKLAETTSTAILVFQEDHFCYLNPACEQISGYSQAELLEKRFWDLVPPEFQEQSRQRSQKRRSGEPVESRMEVKILRKDGAERWLDYTAAPITWDGQPAVLGTAFDITERKLAEEALRQANAYNRSLIEASLDPFVTFGPDNKIFDVNSATEQLTGYDRQELIGTYASDYFTDPQKAHQVYHQALREGSVRDCELELKHRDGHSTPVLYNASLYRNESGEVGGVFAAVRDITRRKQVEAAEREQRQLAEALRESSVALTRSLNLDQVMDQVIDSVGLVVPSDSVSFLLVERREPGSTQVRFTRQRGYSSDGPDGSLQEIRFTLEQTANLRWMAETGKTLAIEEVNQYPGWVNIPQGRWIHSIVGAPVCIKGETVGFIELASATPAFFTSEHAERLEAFAAQAAIAIENARLYEEVLAGRERLQAISMRLVQVQESERRRLARELHDEIGQALTGLKLSLEAGTDQLDLNGGQAELRTRLRQARLQVSELIAKTREISLALRPAMLDDLGLLPALIWQIDRYQEQTGILVQFQASDLEGRRFPAELETAAYRIVQEALTNVARHAQVKQAAVTIWVAAAEGERDSAAGISATGDNLFVSVEDHGAGFDLPAVRLRGEGGGLAGMQERVALLGGRLTIEALAGTGTHLTAVLPL